MCIITRGARGKWSVQIVQRMGKHGDDPNCIEKWGREGLIIICTGDALSNKGPKKHQPLSPTNRIYWGDPLAVIIKVLLEAPRII